MKFCSLALVIVCLYLSISCFFTESKSLLPNTAIIGGYEARPGQFPFIVSLLSSYKPREHFCGGSLIATNYVLTAAHCVYDVRLIDQIYVYAGAYKIAKEESFRQETTVKQIFTHPSYDGMGGSYDIAVLKLNESILMKQTSKGFGNTEIIKLNLNKNLIEDRQVTIAGWGRTSVDDTNFGSKVLKFGTYSAQPLRFCPFGSEDTICVSVNRSSNSPYKGDSGGPIVINDLGNDKSIKLAGVVSSGNSFGMLGTSVSHYIDWIQSITGISV